MGKTNIALGIIFVFAVFGCQSTIAKKAANHPAALSDQSNLVKLVRDAGISDKERALVHVSHSCNVIIAGQVFAVIDMRELVKGAMVARGVNQIILLNAAHQLVNRIEYGQARPLFCENNKLYLYSNLMLDGQAEEGNVLSFSDSGFAVTVTNEDINSKLPLQQ